MKHLLAACALVLAAASLGAQTASGVIDGGVIDDAGSPVPGANVSLLSDTGRVVKAIEADVRGVFIFDVLPEGRYTLTAAKLGYATRTYGQVSPSAGAVVVALGANGRYRARLRIPRLGGLSGTVLDENGQPVSGEVRAQPFVMRDGQRLLDGPTKQTQADRQGRYHFADLPPGDYIVSALGPDGELHRVSADLIQRAQQAVQERSQPLPTKDTSGTSTVSYLAVYYPGVLSRARATAVPIVPGEERTNIDLQLQVVPTLRLQGTVVTTDGKPVAYANVKLVSRDDGMTWSFGQTTSAGVFRLAPVPQGSYVVVTGSTRMDVNLSSPASSTITVQTDTGGNLSGRVQFEGTTPRPDCRKAGCSPMLRWRGQDFGAPASGDVRGVMDEAGPIVFSTVPPGTYSLVLGMPMAGWTIASAVINGHDLADLPLEIGPRQDLSGLLVTFTDRRTELSGTAPVGGTSPTADLVSVVAFPTDRQLWLPWSRRVRVVRPDTSGAYRVTGLPPGEYFVAVVANFDAESELDANHLATLEATATRVAVRAPERQ